MQKFLLLSFCFLFYNVTAEGVFRSGYFYLRNSLICKNDEQCQSIIEDSICDEKNTCTCTEEKLLSSDGSKCLEKVEGFGHACEDNVQCSESLTAGGVCINNKCKCKAGFHYLVGKCWKNVDLNEKCLKDEQCFSAHEYVGLECKNEICECRSQYRKRLDSGCRRKMNLSEACNLDFDCPEGTTCNKMSCSEASKNLENINLIDFKQTSDSISRVNELGYHCEKDSDCEKIKNAVCLDNRICACKSVKFVASEDNKQCLQSARGKVQNIQNSVCKENAQCAVFGGNSICKDGRCACKNGTYWEFKNQFCWTIRQIGDKCTVAEDCHPSETLAECKDKSCKCQEKYHQKGTVCILDPTKVGDYCDEDSECSSFNGFCNESKACECREYYYPQNGKCVPGVKSLCKTSDDCSHLKNTQCRSNNSSSSSRQCLCLDNYVSSNEWKYCLPVVKAGGMCEESFQCTTDLGGFGECGNGICQCKNETHYFYGKCYRSKFVKESCVRLQDCHPGNDTDSVICLKGFCSCNYGYELGGNGLCVKTNSADRMKPFMFGLLAAFFFLR